VIKTDDQGNKSSIGGGKSKGRKVVRVFVSAFSKFAIAIN
jgi:hypothetical protein